MPDKAVVYQNGSLAVIAEAKLKVMLEGDCLTFSFSETSAGGSFSAQAAREVILPLITEEVNSGARPDGHRRK